MLGTIYGDKNLLNKRSEMATIALKIVDYQRVVPGSDWLITACGEIPSLLVKGFKRLAGLALSLMQDGNSPPAGEVKGCHVEGDVVGLTCRVDPTAITKVRHKVYPLIEVSYSDHGQIYAVDLMDRPSGDELAKRGSRRLARLYQREDESEMPLSPSAQAVFAELGRTEAVLKAVPGAGTYSDRMAVRAQNQRAHAQYGIEVIKAARAHPIAYGDRGVINMMRHGRP
jgi:hypothetical protein